MYWIARPTVACYGAQHLRVLWTGLCAVALLCASFTFTSGAWAETIRIGIYENMPKIGLDAKGNPTGFFPDLVEAVALRENWEVVWVAGSWAECLERLAEGEIDLMPDVASTASRTEAYSFGAVPALYGWSQVYRSPSSSIREMLDMEGRKVALLEGSIQEEVFLSLVENFGMRIKAIRVSSFDEGFALVESGGAEAIVTNRFFGERVKSRYGAIETGIVFYPTKLHFVTKKGEGAGILRALDQALTAWKDDGDSPYNAAMRKWLHAPDGHRWSRWGWLISALLLIALAGVAAGLLHHRKVARVRESELEDKSGKLEQARVGLKQAEDLVSRQEGLHMFSQMVGGIAHDFNNTLAVIAGHAEVIQIRLGSGNASPEVRKAAEVILDAALDGAQVVKRMRDIYRPDSGNDIPSCVQVCKLVDDVEHLVQPRIASVRSRTQVQIELIADCESGLLVYGCRGELRDALLNLLFNAIDAMPSGGVVTLKARADGSTVVLTVSDSGDGMDEATLANCRKAFFTTKGAKGTGMGLPMVAATMERHGGNISIRSEVGKGTVVELVFPQTQAVEDPNAEATAAEPVRGLKVLAVDDDPRCLEIYRVLLATDQHKVTTTLSPMEALRLAEREQFDLVLTDHIMPDVTGLRFCQMLIDRGVTAPRIMEIGRAHV